MNTYIATAPNGEIATRTSHRNYTHAGLVLEADGTYTLAGFSSSADLALKAAKREITGWIAVVSNDAKVYRRSNPEKYAKTMANLDEMRARAAKRTPVVVEAKVGA